MPESPEFTSSGVILHRPKARTSHYCHPPCPDCQGLEVGTVWRCSGCEKVYTVGQHGLWGPLAGFHKYWRRATKTERKSMHV